MAVSPGNYRRSPPALSIVVGLSVLLASPALFLPWEEDELFLRGASLGHASWMNTPTDVYRFSSGVVSEVEALIRGGAFPWFAANDFKYAPLRPLASILFTLDAQLGPQRWVAQLHSIVWHVLMVWAVSLVFRRTLEHRSALLASIVVAFSPGLVGPTTWLTNRHVFVGVVPMVFALVGHLDWRERNQRRGLWVAIGGFILGLASSDSAITIVPYVVAYEVFARAGRGASDRFRGLAPLTAILIGYACVFQAIERGGYFFSTFANILQPTVFAMRAGSIPIMLMILLSGSIGYHSLGLLVLGPRLLIALLALPPLLHWRRESTADPQRRHLTWLTAGMVAAVSLVCLVRGFEERALVPGCLGGGAILGITCSATWQLYQTQRKIRGATLVCGAAVALFSLVLPPLEYPLRHWYPAHERRERVGALTATWNVVSHADRVYVVGAPYWLPGQLASDLMQTLGTAKTPDWYLLSLTAKPEDVQRVAPDTLEFSERRLMQKGTFFGVPKQLRVGTELATRGYSLRVVDIASDGTTRVQVRIPGLDAPNVEVVSFRDWRLRRVSLPIGEPARLTTPDSRQPPLLFCGNNPIAWAVFACDHPISDGLFHWMTRALTS